LNYEARLVVVNSRDVNNRLGGNANWRLHLKINVFHLELFKVD